MTSLAAAWHYLEMQWTSVISRADRAADAVTEAVDQVWRNLDGAPDLVVVFASRHLANSIADVPRELAHAFGEATVVGCLAQSVIGGGEEEEHRPALAVTAARLPGVTLRTALVNDTNDLRALDTLVGDVEALMVLADSFTLDAEALVDELDHRFPDALKFGGLASGGIYPGTNVLFAQDRALRQGAVVVSLGGALRTQTVVSQGCRPIGPRLTVASSQGNTIFEFENGRPQAILEEILGHLSPEDQQMAQTAVHIGIRVPGDADDEFLVRPLVGIDPNTGALSINERVRRGDVLQFQFRDPAASTTDLQAALRGASPTASGALLFSCIGRGERFFKRPNHDTDALRAAVGDVPVGGFFCAGEIGPVGRRTFLHGYTSTFVLFEPADE